MQPPTPSTAAANPSTAENAIVALLRAVEAVRLYGPAHAVSADALRALAAASGESGWARVCVDGFELADGPRVRAHGAADFAAALARANIAMLGFFGPLTPEAAAAAAEGVQRVLAARGSARAIIEEIAHHTSGSLRLMPLSAAGIHFEPGPGAASKLDWSKAIDRVLDAMNGQLQSLRESAGVGSPDPRATLHVDEIARAISDVPAEHRARAQEHVRKFFEGLSPEIRRSILDLEPGKEAAHYDAIGLVAEALPVEDVARAVSAATQGGKSLSPHTVRIFSRLIAASREDATKARALRDVVRRWRADLSDNTQHDPALRDALENLLREVHTNEWLPDTHESTIAGISSADTSPAAASPSSPTSELTWDPELDHALSIVQSLQSADAGEATSVRFLLARAELLVEAGRLDELTHTLDTGGDAANQLRTTLSAPRMLDALAAHAGTPGADRLMASLGPEAGAAALTAGAREETRLAPLLWLARAAGPWRDVVARAVALQPSGLAGLCGSKTQLTALEREALLETLLSSGQATAREEALALARATDGAWPAPVVAFALRDASPPLRREALDHMLLGLTPAALPALASYLVDLSRPWWRCREDWVGTMAALAYDQAGAAALAHCVQRLRGQRSARAWWRLFVIADSLRLCREHPDVRRAIGGFFSPLRWLMRVWSFLAILGGAAP